MNSRTLKLNEFIAVYPLWGEWEISYTDATHLEKSEYVKLGKITIDEFEKTARNYPILPFTFKPVTDQEIETRFSELPEGTAQANRAIKLIRDQLADSTLRTGLLRPEFCLMENQNIDRGFRKVMARLSDNGYLILVVDTSALRRAVISFLHKTLSKVLIWTVVPVFVMTEVQRQVKSLNDTWEASARGAKPHTGKCGVLSERPQVSCVSRELNHIRQWRPIEMLTTLPEHLGQSNGTSNIDRLIIESTKNLKRDRGLQESVYLLTGDKDMASLASLENLDSLYVGVPPLPLEVSSVRYDSYKEKLVLAPIHYLLWDLAQVFSTIRFENKKLSQRYELAYYSQANQGFFAHDMMEIREER